MKRRKVGSMLALAVLSVALDGPRHPYEMATVLKERGKDADMPIKWGSLYTVVRNLAKHGFLEAVESTRDGGRPERTVYALTDAGREELDDWVRELVGTVEREPPRFQAGLSLIGALGPDRTIELLGKRLHTLDVQLAAKRKSLGELRTQLPRMLLIEAEFDLALADAEAAYVRGLLADLTTGTMPGVAEWRTWHETGVLPEDLSAFIDKGQK